VILEMSSAPDGPR